VSVVQAIAAFTLTGQTASLFPSIDGEPVERVMVAVSPGEASTLSLVTKSGRKVRVEQLRAEQQQQVARAWQILKETHVE
jgi:predicted  nucleic acid-binding Zn ribbon protein